MQLGLPDFLLLPFCIVNHPMTVEQLNCIAAFITDGDGVCKEELPLIWV